MSSVRSFTVLTVRELLAVSRTVQVTVSVTVWSTRTFAVPGVALTLLTVASAGAAHSRAKPKNGATSRKTVL